MKLDRPLVFIDVEGTGTDAQADRILELSLLELDCEGVRTRTTFRFNPGRTIPAAATAIHGITDADVAHLKPIDAAAGMMVLREIEGRDIAGYNLRRYDLPILDEELRRVGMKLDLRGVAVVDCYGIFAKKESRTLSDAVRKYCGREHDGAHGADADNLATLDVLLGQMQAYPDLKAMPLADLAKFSQVDDVEYVDVARKLYRDKDGDLCYGFGKLKGVKVRDDMGYAHWMLDRADFPGSTDEALVAELERVLGILSGPAARIDPEIPF